MRKQIAAANWKMNLSLVEAENLLNELLATDHTVAGNQEVVFAVPAIYIPLATQKLAGKNHVYVAAQNCHQKTSGAYTGELSASMLQSVGVHHIVLGHSERRELFFGNRSLLINFYAGNFLYNLRISQIKKGLIAAQNSFFLCLLIKASWQALSGLKRKTTPCRSNTKVVFGTVV